MVVCRAVPSTTPNCTFPASLLVGSSNPCLSQHLSPVNRNCHPSSAIRRLSSVIPANPIPVTLPAALPRDDGFSLLSHPHKAEAPRRAPSEPQWTCTSASNTTKTAKLAHAGASRTRTFRHTTRLGSPPCGITPYHLTCWISCETPELARGHLCCLLVLGKAGGRDCGASSSSCCCRGSHCRRELFVQCPQTLGESKALL